jgi:peroxiredoxin Q/BCP
MECKSLRESGSEIRAFDVAYFAASVDPLDLITKFAKSLEADYPMLADPDSVAAKAYGVVSPDRAAPRRWTFYIGKDGKLLYVDRVVKAATAGPDVARRLAELGVAKKGS